MEIKTLQDFLTLTKGQEYLMAIGAIALFTIFFMLIDRGKKKTSSKKDN